MKTKIHLILLFTICSLHFSIAQTNINDYKYVVVPTTFDFLSEPDKYRLNTLTKLLFEKYGFTTIMADKKLPDDAISNNCLMLQADVLKEPGVFNSKLKVQLKNCKKEIVFTSNIGKSKEKNYQVAYSLALREAFKSFDTFTYQYKESAGILAYGNKEPKENSAEIEKLKEEIKILKKEKETVTPQLLVEKEMVAVTEPIKVELKPQSTENLEALLYAQKVTNGFQLVNSLPKVIYTIKKTGMSNVFLVSEINAILYQLDANWVLEYYENEKLQTKILNIKF